MVSVSGSISMPLTLPVRERTVWREGLGRHVHRRCRLLALRPDIIGERDARALVDSDIFTSPPWKARLTPFSVAVRLRYDRGFIRVCRRSIILIASN